jgi:hypothetical protein
LRPHIPVRHIPHTHSGWIQSHFCPPAFLSRRLTIPPSPSARRRELQSVEESERGDTRSPNPTAVWIWVPTASPARPTLLLLLVVEPARVLRTLGARMVLLQLLHHRRLAIPVFEGTRPPQRCRMSRRGRLADQCLSLSRQRASRACEVSERVQRLFPFKMGEPASSHRLEPCLGTEER